MLVALRLILFLFFILSIPKYWNALKGSGSHQFNKSLLKEQQNFLPPEYSQILTQPFFYWKKGSQFYAFLSKDGQFVLKIPRASKVGGSLIKKILSKLPPTEEFLASIKHASQFLSEETALLYAHYGITNQFFPSIFLYDRIGRPLSIDLNSTPFVLQMRKELLSKALEKEHNLERKKQILGSFLDLVLKEQEKGWMSRDKAFLLNISYAEGKAWRIDVGSYIPLEKNFSLKEAAKPVCHWLKQQDPQLYIWFEQELSKRISLTS